jgi:HPt (histidine-containing phosphotransfer) domain-containing protein
MHPIWDPAPMVSLQTMPLATRVQLIEHLLESSLQRLDQVAAGLAAGDLEAITDAVHPLKSACGSVGATWLSAHASAIERACRDQRLDLAAHLWQREAAHRDASLAAMRRVLTELQETYDAGSD